MPAVDEGQIPVVPLPTPEQSFPVFPGPDEGQIPVVPLPTPEQSFPVYPGPGGGQTPSMPTPSVPSIPTPGTPSIPGGAIQPLPGSGNVPVYAGYAAARFLNAAYGYRPLRIYVGSALAVPLLGASSVSAYVRLPSGYQTITVAGRDGYIYLQRTLPFVRGERYTVAIVNRAGGLELVQISDACCAPARQGATFRVSNLAYNSGPIDVLLSDGRVVFADVRFKETTSAKRIAPGAYQFLFAETNLLPAPAYTDIETLDSAFIGMNPLPDTVATLYLQVQGGHRYSVFLVSSGPGYNAVTTLVVED